MEVRILGPLEVLQGGRQAPLGGAKQRALLAALALRADEAVSVESLVDALWGRTAAAERAKARAGLRLRASTGARGRGSHDGAARPMGSCSTAGRSTWRSSRGCTQAAGRPLRPATSTPRRTTCGARSSCGTGRRCPTSSSRVPLRRTAHGLSSSALGRSSSGSTSISRRGRHVDVVPELEALVDDHPFQERFRELLMLALYRCGRQTDALAQYRVARDALDELGLAPGESLAELERAILVHAPELAPPESAREAPAARARPGRSRVTVLACELLGDADRLFEAQAAVGARLDEVATRHKAAVQGVDGGPSLLVFGSAAAREDDALRAARAALALAAGPDVGRAAGEDRARERQRPHGRGRRRRRPALGRRGAAGDPPHGSGSGRLCRPRSGDTIARRRPRSAATGRGIRAGRARRDVAARSAAANAVRRPGA